MTDLQIQILRAIDAHKQQTGEDIDGETLCRAVGASGPKQIGPTIGHLVGGKCVTRTSVGGRRTFRLTDTGRAWLTKGPQPSSAGQLLYRRAKLLQAIDDLTGTQGRAPTSGELLELGEYRTRNGLLRGLRMLQAEGLVYAPSQSGPDAGRYVITNAGQQALSSVPADVRRNGVTAEELVEYGDPRCEACSGDGYTSTFDARIPCQCAVQKLIALGCVVVNGWPCWPANAVRRAA